MDHPTWVNEKAQCFVCSTSQPIARMWGVQQHPGSPWICIGCSTEVEPHRRACRYCRWNNLVVIYPHHFSP